MRVAIIGRSHILYDTIRPLVEAGHDIAGVITCRETPEYSRTSEDFRMLAEELGVPFLFTEKINSEPVLHRAAALKADIGVSINWRTIVGRPFREQFPRGIINVHVGDLPRYRGNAPIAWAILNGESKVVLTLHLMEDALDAGPILTQKPIPLTNETYIGDVWQEVEQATPSLLVKAVSGIADGSITPRPQSDDPNLALRGYPRGPEDGLLDWNQPAEYLARQVRACSEPYAGAFTYLGHGRLTVWRAHSEPAPMPCIGVPGQIAERRRSSGEVIVVTTDGLLVLETLELEQTGRKAAAEVIKTIRLRLGMDMAGEVRVLHQKLDRLLEQVEQIAVSRKNEPSLI